MAASNLQSNQAGTVGCAAAAPTDCTSRSPQMRPKHVAPTYLLHTHAPLTNQGYPNGAAADWNTNQCSPVAQH